MRKQMVWGALMTAVFLLLACASGPEARPSNGKIVQGFGDDPDAAAGGDNAPSGPAGPSAVEAEPEVDGAGAEADDGYDPDEEADEYGEEGDEDESENEEEDQEESWE